MLKSYNLLLNQYKFLDTIRNKLPQKLLEGEDNKCRIEFFDALECGQLKTENVERCLCGSDEIKIISKTDRLYLPFGSFICKECGLVSTSPRLTEESLEFYYKRFYHPLVLGKELFTSSESLFKSKQGEKIYNTLRPYINKKNISVLEIGAGTGSVLREFKGIANANGITVEETGTEYNKNCIDGARKDGVNLVYGDLRTIKDSAVKFDIVILSHVFEHFINLSSEINLLGDVLNHDGLLYVEVPGLFDIHKKSVYNYSYINYRVHAHMYDFTLTTLNNIFCKYGWELIDGNELVEAVYRKSGEQQSEIINDYSNILWYLNFLEQNQEYFSGMYKTIQKKDEQIFNRDQAILSKKEREEKLLVLVENRNKVILDKEEKISTLISQMDTYSNKLLKKLSVVVDFSKKYFRK